MGTQHLPDFGCCEEGDLSGSLKAVPELIEDEAARLVRNGKRQGTYGHPRGDFDTIAKMWSAILSKFNQQEVRVDAEQVALLMIAMKLSRLARDPSHHDSRVDIIGYAICLDRLDEPYPA